MGHERMAKVLVVDDEDVLLDMLAALVEDLGHEPITATNGRDALARLAEQPEPPRLILSDVMMPRMNGIEFAANVKNDPMFRQVPIILMSAASRPREGMVADHFVHKPCDLDMLAALIEDYVDRSARQ
jgi:CheY-like chemotaxis protein